MKTNYRFLNQYASEEYGIPLLSRLKTYFDYPSHESKTKTINDKLEDLGGFITIGGNLRAAIAQYRQRHDPVYTSTIYDTLLHYVSFLRTGEAITELNLMFKKRLSVTESQLIDILIEELKIRTQVEYDNEGSPIGFKLSNVNAQYDLDKYVTENDSNENKLKKIILGHYLIDKAYILDDTPEKLYIDNPWLRIAYEIEGQGYENPKYAVHAEDRQIVEAFNAQANDEHRLRLDLPPEQFQGNPLNAEVIILMLNPGFVEKCNVGKYEILSITEQKEFIKAKCATMSMKDELCVPDNDIINAIGEQYWPRKLKYVMETIPNANKKIAVVNVLGYFSVKYKPIPKKLFGIDEQLLYTQKFTIRLVQYLMNKGKVIIIARGEKEWYRLIPKLETYVKKVLLNSYRNPSITPNNCQNNGFKLIEEALVGYKRVKDDSTHISIRGI